MTTMLLAPRPVHYSYGSYNKCNKTEQWIRLTEGCPHHHPYCYEPTEIKIFEIPNIVRRRVKIMDMNLLCKPEALSILQNLGTRKVNGKNVTYELICGIDYRFLTPEIAVALKKARFKNVRIAWDWYYTDQIPIKKALWMLFKVGYKPNDVMVFMICNWKIRFEENMKKLDLCKVWNVQVCDCYYDNQIKKIEPVFWSGSQIKEFRHRVRSHNQLVNFKIDPEVAK